MCRRASQCRGRPTAGRRDRVKSGSHKQRSLLTRLCNPDFTRSLARVARPTLASIPTSVPPRLRVDPVPCPPQPPCRGRAFDPRNSPDLHRSGIVHEYIEDGDEPAPTAANGGPARRRSHPDLRCHRHRIWSGWRDGGARDDLARHEGAHARGGQEARHQQRAQVDRVALRAPAARRYAAGSSRADAERIQHPAAAVRD